MPTPPVTTKLTSIKVYKEDLALLEESVKDAETHETISTFKQFKNLSMYVHTYACLQEALVCISWASSTLIGSQYNAHHMHKKLCYEYGKPWERNIKASPY